nr:GFA family protein [Chamaesiphon sp. OTE_20_metabat_361]
MSKLNTYDGGCHCGKIRYRVVIEKLEAVECNCSICIKKGFIHLIVPAERFTLLQGQDDLSTYTFNTGTAKHHFCRHCGIHAFYRPRSHPDGYDVNLRCLDDGAIDLFAITYFDGAHWEDKIDQIRDRYS